MSIRPKTKRRVVILLVSAVALVCVAAGAYVFRLQQLNRRAKQARVVALEADKAQDYATAMTKMGVYLSRFPTDADALFVYARARQNVPERGGKHVTQAISLYRRVLDLKPDHAEALRALLDLYLQIGFNAETEATADAILAKSPEDLAALRAKATAEMRLRRFDVAGNIAAQCIEVAPQDLESHLIRFNCILKTGKVPQGKAKPGKAVAGTEKAEGPEKLEPAEVMVREALKLQRAKLGDFRCELLQSMAYRIAGNATKAVELARKAATREPPDEIAAMAIVDQLDALGLYEESLAVLGRVGKGSASLRIQRLAAARLLQAGQFEDAAGRLAGVDPTKPATDVDLLGLRAMALMQGGRAAEAKPIVEALGARRSDLTATTWEAFLKTVFAPTQPEAKAVAQVCQDGLAINPGNPYFLFHAGKAYAEMGERELAIQQFRQCVAAAPTWPAPLIEMARALTAIGRYQEGVDAAQAARKRAPKDPAAMTALLIAWAPAVNTAPKETLSDVLGVINEVQAIAKEDEQTVPLQIVVLSRLGKRDAAMAAVRAVLERKPPASESLLLRLAATARQEQLGLEEACFSLSENTWGLSAALASSRAMGQFEAGRAQEGRQLLKAAKEGPHKGEELDWRMAWARYLDLIQDPEAKAAIVALADERPDALPVQWMALGAKSTQGDREFLGRTIDRIRAQTGDQGMTWRLERARWLLQGKASEQEMAEATVMLNEVSRAAPDMLVPHMLLANCLERMGNVSGAIEQLKAAANVRPDSTAIALELARLLQAKGEFDGARDQLERVIQNKGATVAEKRQAAAYLAQQGDSERALKLLQAANALPDEKNPDIVVAAIYRQRNWMDKAEAITRKLLEKPDAATIRFAAELYAAQGKLKEADQVLAMLDRVQAKPGIKEVIRGLCYQAMGRPEQAVAQLMAATRAAPDNAAMWRQAIAVCLASGRSSEAMVVNEQALRSLPGNATFELLRKCGGIVVALAKDEQIRPVMLGLLGSESESAAAAEAIQLYASVKSANGPVEQAASKLRPLADRNPKFLPLQMLMSRLYISAGRAEEAVTLSTRAMQLAPNAAEPAALATGALAGLGRWAEALATAQQWRERSLSRPMQADIAIATAQLGLGEHAKAAATLEPYLTLAKAQPDTYRLVLVLYAQSQIALRKTDAAAGILRPLIEKSAEWRKTWMRLAERQIPDARVAGNWLEEVAPLIPQDASDEQVALAQAWCGLAQRSKNVAQLETARKAVERASKRVAASTAVKPEELLALGMLHEMLGDTAAAEAGYRRALQMKADLPVAQNNLAMLLVKGNGDLKDAMALALQAAQAKHPLQANFCDTLAEIQAKIGDFKGAIKSLNDAIKLQPQELEWKINLASVHARAGEKPQAITLLDQIDALQPDPAKLSTQGRERLEALRRELRATSALQPR